MNSQNLGKFNHFSWRKNDPICNDRNISNVCNICNRSYEDEDILKDHIERVHEKPRKFQCDICEKAFSLKMQI